MIIVTRRMVCARNRDDRLKVKFCGDEERHPTCIFHLTVGLLNFMQGYTAASFQNYIEKCSTFGVTNII